MQIASLFRKDILMNQIIKKTFLFTLLPCLLIPIGCSEQSSEQITPYSTELASYFPSDQGTDLNYFGSAEYAHNVVLDKVSKNANTLVLNFKGQITDLSDGGSDSSAEDFLFENQYVIDNSSVRELQLTPNRRYSQSIIRNQIILKLPIAVGNTWSQKVSIDNKEYTATTKIVEISTEGIKNSVKTETTIKGLKQYPDETYKELRTYKKGYGISSYQANIMLDNPGELSAPFEFQYWLYDHE